MSAPRRILMTADTVGGVWTYALELAAALAPHGVGIALAIMGAPLSEAQRAEVARVPNVEVFESRYKLEWMDEPWDDVAAAGEWLLGLAARLRPDVVHLNGYAHAALPWPAPALAVAHSCVCSWWEAVKGEPAPASWDTYRRAVARGLESAALVVAPSRAMLDALRRHYGVGAARVIPNARTAVHFPPRPKAPFIMAAGRLWDEAKNIAALAEVAPRLSAPVIVCGADPRRAAGLLDRPNLTSPGLLSQTELSRYYGRAAIYALPARYEPFGLSVLEAALAGCALVLGDIPSLRENWDGAALFVPPADLDALESALRRLLSWRDEREHLAARARRRALEFTPERMAAAYLAAYASAKSGNEYPVTGFSLCA
jgi:glycogen(starch) synthase